MRLISNPADEMRGVQTWEAPDGRRVQLDARAVREFGAEALMRRMGLCAAPSHLPRVPIYYDGGIVGTVPGDFHPINARSRSPLYDPRPGDFMPHADGWQASQSLGPGDLAAHAGFRRL